MKILVSCLALIWLCLAAVPLSAADWHVYPSGGGNAETIAEAAELASSGDVIYIHSGTYVEQGILFESKDVFIVTPDGKIAETIGGVSPMENVKLSLAAVQRLAD